MPSIVSDRVQGKKKKRKRKQLDLVMANGWSSLPGVLINIKKVYREVERKKFWTHPPIDRAQNIYLCIIAT